MLLNSRQWCSTLAYDTNELHLTSLKVNDTYKCRAVAVKLKCRAILHRQPHHGQSRTCASSSEVEQVLQHTSSYFGICILQVGSIRVLQEPDFSGQKLFLPVQKIWRRNASLAGHYWNSWKHAAGMLYLLRRALAFLRFVEAGLWLSVEAPKLYWGSWALTGIFWDAGFSTQFDHSVTSKILLSMQTNICMANCKNLIASFSGIVNNRLIQSVSILVSGRACRKIWWTEHRAKQFWILVQCARGRMLILTVFVDIYVVSRSDWHLMSWEPCLIIWQNLHMWQLWSLIPLYQIREEDWTACA